MHLTVAICTWNRARLLEQTLSQITALTIPEQVTWELVLVNNNSNDDTPAVVSSFEGRLPIRHVFEGAPGICNARNRAMREAAGTYILWTDDDVLVEPTWMSAYLAAFARRPGAGFFGGVIRPWFPEASPDWLLRGFPHVAAAFAALDMGATERRFEVEQLPYGANMAVKTIDQLAFPYNPSIGARPGSALRGEETEVFQRMLAAGVPGYWIPDAIVRHYIPPERQTIRYLREYYKGLGGYRALTATVPGPRLFGKPRWTWRLAIEQEVQYRLGRLLGRPERWVLNLREASVARGWLTQR